MEEKKLALITGASGVIGEAIAKLLAINNIDLILQYHKNEERIAAIAETCKKSCVNVLTIKADLSNYRNLEGMFTQLDKQKLFPNILINSIGMSHYGLIQDVDYDKWQEVININLGTPFFSAQRVIPKMVSRGFGRIINISSIWGEKGAANEALYSTTKGAVNTFTRSLAKELAPSGITVNAIAPGIVMSQMMSSFSLEEIEGLKQQIPLGRFADPQEIATMVLHLLQEDSSYITGQIIGIAGGWD